MADALASAPASSTIHVSGAGMVAFINGKRLKSAEAIEAGRDLAEIAGAFRISYLDTARAFDALGGDKPEFAMIKEHDHAEIRIGDETVLKGFVDAVQLRIADGQVEAVISGRDVTGDLVDCCANPLGPGEYRQVDLTTIVGRLTKPFGIPVKSDIDPGAPFTLVAVEPSDRVLSAVEKLSRQRGALVVSDGVGGLRLTRAGTTRAPGALRVGDNIIEAETQIDARGHFSDIYVKGAFKSVLRPPKAPLHAGLKPGKNNPAPSSTLSASEIERRAVLRYGHAIDPSLNRYRPAVFLAATQSGGSEPTQMAQDVKLDSTAEGLSAQYGPAPKAYHGQKRHKKRKARPPRQPARPWTLQDQADWRMRTTRAHGTIRLYTVQGYGVHGVLWRPNTVIYVFDPYAGIDQDMLVGAVTYVADASGYRTRISVVPLDTYDLTGAQDRVQRGVRRSGKIRARAR